MLFRSQPVFDYLANAVGCGTATKKIQCMRAVGIREVMSATDQLPGIASFECFRLPFVPHMDGKFLTAESGRLLAEGKWDHNVAIINGNQHDEGAPRICSRETDRLNRLS